MPIYCYQCACGALTERYHRRMPRRVPPETRCDTCGKRAARDLRAEFSGVRNASCGDLISEAAGINPSQIPEAKRLFPHHEYTPDGRMVFHGRQHKLRCLRDIGMHDKEEVRGGPPR